MAGRPTNLVGHEQQTIILVDPSAFEFANYYRAHVLVLLRDGHHHGPVDLAVHHRHGIE